MRPSATDEALLWDMLDACRSACAFVAGMTLAQFAADRRTYRAVERELEIIGEAARGVSEDFRAAHLEIPWAQIIGQRNVLAHGYAIVRHDLLWQVVTEHLPGLIVDLEPLVSHPPASN